MRPPLPRLSSSPPCPAPPWSSFPRGIISGSLPVVCIRRLGGTRSLPRFRSVCGGVDLLDVVEPLPKYETRDHSQTIEFLGYIGERGWKREATLELTPIFTRVWTIWYFCCLAVVFATFFSTYMDQDGIENPRGELAGESNFGLNHATSSLFHRTVPSHGLLSLLGRTSHKL